MQTERLMIKTLPAIIWGKPTNSVYIFVHGRHSNKDEAIMLAEIAQERGFQVISFDLAQHGDRATETERLTVQNGVHDLSIIVAFISQRWNNISFYGCSIGAYIGLIALKDMHIQNTLLHSPILDMERLIQNMMKWSNVSESDLQDKQEIPTSFGEPLSWPYYSFVKDNRITKWNSPTHIIYGTRDNLTELDIVNQFTDRFHCTTTFLEGAEHYFQNPEHISALYRWIAQSI